MTARLTDQDLVAIEAREPSGLCPDNAGCNAARVCVCDALVTLWEEEKVIIADLREARAALRNLLQAYRAASEAADIQSAKIAVNHPIVTEDEAGAA